MSSDLWCPWAVRHLGPAAKREGVRSGKGGVLHSAEGPLTASFRILAKLDGAPAEWQKSWHFTVAKDGAVYQHYPLDAVCWHAGPKANPFYAGIEHEGVAGESLTPEQLAAAVRLVGWIAAVEGWPGLPLEWRHRLLFEHNEFMATACPSGRIPWPDLLGRLAAGATAVPERPPAPDVIMALVSAGEFVRRGWSLRDLVEEDKAAIRWVAGEVG